MLSLQLTIDARMEQTGSDGNRIYQEVSRKLSLPEDVDLNNLKSLFSAADGVLTIEAPFKNPPKVENGPKEIPVNRVTSDSGQKLD